MSKLDSNTAMTVLLMLNLREARKHKRGYANKKRMQSLQTRAGAKNQFFLHFSVVIVARSETCVCHV